MSLVSLLRKSPVVWNLAAGKTVRLGDKTYRIKGFVANPLALNGKNLQASEPWLDVIFDSILRSRQGTFLDVGANLGQTMFKLLRLDPAVQYVGFEPQVSCCLMTQKFLEENHLTNCKILPVGLFNSNRFIKLHTGSGDYDCAASMVDGFRPESFYAADRYVCVRKGDDVVSELGIPSICGIKVDVEGAELEVFEGLLETIEKTRPFLIFEVLNHFLAMTGTRLDEATLKFRELRIARLESLLRPRGYEIFNILPGSVLMKVGRITPPVSSDLSVTNYIAAPASGLDAFLKAFRDLGGTIQNEFTMAVA